MSKQPLILPTSSRNDGARGKHSIVRNLFILAISLIVVIVVLNLIAGSLSSPAVAPTTPMPVASESTAPTATPEPTATPAGVYYKDCNAVWAALGRPIFKEDPGYRIGLDWDGDGIGCEDNPSTPQDEAKINWGAVRQRLTNNAQDLGDKVAPKVKDFWNQANQFFTR